VDIGNVAEQRIEAAAEQRDRTPAGSPEPERKYSFLNILHAAISGRRQTRAAHILADHSRSMPATWAQAARAMMARLNRNAVHADEGPPRFQHRDF
jgi:hypothetical protein